MIKNKKIITEWVLDNKALDAARDNRNYIPIKEECFTCQRKIAWYEIIGSFGYCIYCHPKLKKICQKY